MAPAMSWSPTVLLAAVLSACATPVATTSSAAPDERWLNPSDLAPRGAAPGARHRLLATRPDGSKDYFLLLARGDEIAAALSAFARVESVVAARFAAIGAVRDAEVAFFDMERKQFKGMRRSEQMEVLSLTGDIGRGQAGSPLVHAHAVLGRSDGSAFGGHLVSATAWPTLEVFVTTFPLPLQKRKDPEIGVELFDLAPADR
jgi:uncharacterized protein